MRCGITACELFNLEMASYFTESNKKLFCSGRILSLLSITVLFVGDVTAVQSCIYKSVRAKTIQYDNMFHVQLQPDKTQREGDKKGF